jgi:hypothetical protein
MTLIPEAPPYAAITRGLNEAVAAAREAGLSLATRLGEQATLTSRFTFGVNSAAVVDGIAADVGVLPMWTSPWTYAATWTEGTVTVTVSFTTDPPVAPADAAAIEVPGRAA